MLARSGPPDSRKDRSAEEGNPEQTRRSDDQRLNTARLALDGRQDARLGVGTIDLLT